MSAAPVVQVEGLCKRFGGSPWPRVGGGTVALDDVSFRVEAGEFVALVGESGSGKTTLARCLLGLLPFDSGSVQVAGYRVEALTRRERRAFRRAAQIVFQNPYSSFNPAFRVRRAIAEAVRIHRALPRPERAAEVEHLAEQVHLPVRRLDEFPSSLSGGERRRVAFARALATRPAFVATDEPVSGLDLPIQLQLLDLLRRIHERRELTFLLISHDMRAVRYLASRVLVLFRGRLVEDAPTRAFFAGGARHPYSRELLESAFRPQQCFRGRQVVAHGAHADRGCPFRQRCVRARVEAGSPCATMRPPLISVGPAHRVACHRWKD